MKRSILQGHWSRYFGLVSYLWYFLLVYQKSHSSHKDYCFNVLGRKASMVCWSPSAGPAISGPLSEERLNMWVDDQPVNDFQLTKDFTAVQQWSSSWSQKTICHRNDLSAKNEQVIKLKLVIVQDMCLNPMLVIGDGLLTCQVSNIFNWVSDTSIFPNSFVGCHAIKNVIATLIHSVPFS